MPRRQAKTAAELKLLIALQKQHGYSLLKDTANGRRFEFIYNFKTRSGCMARIVRLAVPTDSALGRQMANLDKTSGDYMQWVPILQEPKVAKKKGSR